MKFYLKISTLAVAAMVVLAACSGLNVEKTPLAQPQDSPEDAQPAPVTFSQIRFAIPTGTPVRSYSPKGFLGIVTCDIPYGMEESGVSSRSFPNDDYRRIFLDTLADEGFDVAGDPGRMFDEEEDEMRASYAVGARVKDIKMDLCRRGNIWGAYRGETGETSITIEWTVFDLLHRRNVYKTTTKGYANHKLPNYETVPLLLEQAFAAAVHNLGADQSFHDLVFYGHEPEGEPDTVQDINEEPMTKYDPREKVTLGPQAASTQPAQGRLENIEKVAVMIEAGATHGSGFFITKEGHIVTNAHVVGNALRVRVVSSGKKEKMIAEVLRVDRRRDVALLKLEEIPADLNITVLPVRPDEPQVGEEVYAVGAPRYKQLQDTVTKGIVSAHRYNRKEKQPYIQADVDTYPGNSGGPLIDSHGNIVGLCALGFTIAPNTMGGLNWFIPINDALEQLGVGPT